MQSFYRRYYENPQSEAVKNSKEYKEQRNRRCKVETELENKINEVGEELAQLFELYTECYGDEIDIALEQMYLLGASDRERMLR